MGFYILKPRICNFRMLDDLDKIGQLDSEDAFGIVENQWKQLTYQFGTLFEPKTQILNVVLGGMGGSSWPASYVKTWPGLNLPFEIVKDYRLPSYIGENTLFIASSYSGNTEETLSMLEEAIGKNAQVIVITSGGKLKQEAEHKHIPIYLIPPNLQPRMSSFYIISALLELFTNLELVSSKDSGLENRRDIGKWLHEEIQNWKPNVPIEHNPAKQLATKLFGKIVIIYSGPQLSPVSNKIKICINENAKSLAWENQYPEFNHNEFIGWTSSIPSNMFGIVEIRSDLEHPKTQLRFETTEVLLTGKRPSPNIISPQGKTLPHQIFWTSVFGDYVSLYLAMLNGQNPTPVDLIEKFKDMHAKRCLEK